MTTTTTEKGRIEKESFLGLIPGKLYAKQEKWQSFFLYSWGYVVGFYNKEDGWESNPLEQRHDEVLLFVGTGYPTSRMRFPVFLCPDGNLRVPDVTCCESPLDYMELASKSNRP